jgi:hypothetical protein
MDDVLTMIADLRAEIVELRRRVDRLESPQSDDEQDEPLKQAAFEFSVSLGWLYDHRHSGEIGQHRIGGRVLVDRGAIARLVAPKKTCANSGA